MAGELFVSNPLGGTLYGVLYDRATGKVWNTSTGAFETYSAGNWTSYDIAMTAGGHLYTADLPSAVPIVTSWYCLFYIQGGGSPATTDQKLADELPGQGGIAAPGGVSITSSTSLFAFITDDDFIRDMSVHTNITTAQRLSAMISAEQRTIDRLLGHGYSIPATTWSGSVVVGTGGSYVLRHLIHRETEIDLLTAAGQLASRAEAWKEELDSIWKMDIRAKRFMTSNYFTETPTSSPQHGKVQSIRLKRT